MKFVRETTPIEVIPTWSLKLPPYGVQIKALMRAERRHNYAYFMEMGLGKTAVVLAEFIRYQKAGLVDGLVVICPNSLKRTWADQAEKFGSGISSAIWPLHGTVQLQDPWMLVMNYEATITTNGGKRLLGMLRGARCMLVLDESIQIKNYKARRTKTLIALSEYAAYRRILSGKPVVQGPHDLWAQLRFIYGHQGLNYFQFRAHFCKMGGYLGKQVVGAQNAEQLYQMVDQVAFRARKDDWLDLPPKIYETREIEMTKEQKKHYMELHDDLYTMIKGQEIVTTMMISAMLKMQQVTSGFVIGPGKVEIELDGGNPKLEALVELLEEIDGKTVIFCYFRHSVRKIVDRLKWAGYNAAGFMGGDDPAVIKEFNTDRGPDVLVVQIQSGKYGHDMLGTEKNRCATVIFFENSYSLDDRAQAEDRPHRIGQTKPVVYIDLVASSVDKAAIKALQRKEDVSLAVIDNIKRG